MYSMPLIALINSALLIYTASAAGTLGFALGTKRPDNSCKTQVDYEADFDAIVRQSPARIVRGYAASDCNAAANILPAARKKGFQVILGIWPDLESTNIADLSAVQRWAPLYAAQVYAVTVGSETLYRGNFTATQLRGKIAATRRALAGRFRIGTADTWNKFADGTADAVLVGQQTTGDNSDGRADIVLVNGFAFWQGTAIGDAGRVFVEDMERARARIAAVSRGQGLKSIEVWTGETGWPTSGRNVYGAAVGGVVQAQQFWREGVCVQLQNGQMGGVFYFEAFDEPNKPVATGENGVVNDETHWGAMYVDRTAKWSLTC